MPRVVEHGSAAFAEIDSIRGLFPLLMNASYQIVQQDFGKLVFCTSGTNTYTLPSAADLPDGWFCRLRNRNGVNLTLNPTGADTINGSALNDKLPGGLCLIIIGTDGRCRRVITRLDYLHDSRGQPAKSAPWGLRSCQAPSLARRKCCFR